ncbi:MAG: TetR/AcrR family transcriptional regulator C-terminal domain-containing protein [Acidobacteriaceae bacterium]
MLSAPPGMNAMRHMKRRLVALTEPRMNAEQKLRLLAMVGDFVFWYALREAAGDAKVEAEFAAAQIAAGVFPQLAAASDGGRTCASEDRFEAELRLPLGALGAKASRLLRNRMHSSNSEGSIRVR